MAPSSRETSRASERHSPCCCPQFRAQGSAGEAQGLRAGGASAPQHSWGALEPPKAAAFVTSLACSSLAPHGDQPETPGLVGLVPCPSEGPLNFPSTLPPPEESLGHLVGPSYEGQGVQRSMPALGWGESRPPPRETGTRVWGGLGSRAWRGGPSPLPASQSPPQPFFFCCQTRTSWTLPPGPPREVDTLVGRWGRGQPSPGAGAPAGVCSAWCKWTGECRSHGCRWSLLPCEGQTLFCACLDKRGCV